MIWVKGLRGSGIASEAARGQRDEPASPYSPPLRDDEVEDARKDPLALIAIALIIIFQATGSLIGLSRDFLPDDIQGAAVMDVELRASDAREAPPLADGARSIQ